MSRLPAYEEAFDEDEEEELGDTEEGDIIARLQTSGKGTLYEDSSFPARRTSLYRNAQSIPEYDANRGEATWIYAHEICQDPDYFKEDTANGCVVKGRLDDTWLLGALGVLAAHPGTLIENLFASEPDDFKEYGVYTCRFYKNGEWQEVVTDTRIPCTHQREGEDIPIGQKCPGSPVPMYGRAVNLNEQWVPLLEKAYAKLHGTYESLNRGSIAEALVDLTGGCCEKLSFTSDKMKSAVEDGSAWDMMLQFMDPNHVVACVQADPNRVPCLDRETGLLVNHAQSIIDMKECSGFQLVRIRNPWSYGEWVGDWSDASPLWEDYPEVHATVSSDKQNPWQRDSHDGTFWMCLSDFVRYFSKVYLCRVFPDKTYRQYCVHGEWSGKTAGGSTKPVRRGSVSKIQKDGQDRMKDSLRRESIINIKADGDPYWFNNPQYRLSADEPTEVHISLMQQDRRMANHLRDNYRIAFEVIQSKRNSLHRRFAYNVIPHPMETKREGKFTLRIFSKKDVCVEPVADTHTLSLHGSWDRTSERDTAGGPLRVVDENKGVKNNPKWCQNPQYWLTIPPGAQYQTVDVKIVLRRQAESGHVRGKTATPPKPRRSSLTHNALMGMVVCKASPPEEDAPRKRPAMEPRLNALGEPLPVKASSLKRPTRPRADPYKEDSKPALPDRKITIEPLEWCQMSDYRSAEASTTMLKNLRSDSILHGLFLVPTLSEKGVKGAYTLEIHSDHPVEVDELPETVSKTIAAEWNSQTAGGSHLHPDWKKNPTFHLRLRSRGPAKVKIVLSRPEKDWKNKCIKDPVGCMMGFYIMTGSRPNRNSSIFHEGRPYEGSPMVPTHSVSTPSGFMLESFSEDDIFTIMPSTFEPGKVGPFFISVVTNVEFSLRRDRGEATSKGANKGNKRPSGGHNGTLAVGTGGGGAAAAGGGGGGAGADVRSGTTVPSGK